MQKKQSEGIKYVMNRSPEPSQQKTKTDMRLFKKNLWRDLFPNGVNFSDIHRRPTKFLRILN